MGKIMDFIFAHLVIGVLAGTVAFLTVHAPANGHPTLWDFFYLYAVFAVCLEGVYGWVNGLCSN